MDAREAPLPAGRSPQQLSPDLLCKFAKCFGIAAFPEAKVASPIIVQSHSQRPLKAPQDLRSVVLPRKLLRSESSPACVSENESPTRASKLPPDASVCYWTQHTPQHSSDTPKVEPFSRNVLVRASSSAGRLPATPVARDLQSRDVNSLSKSASRSEPSSPISKAAQSRDTNSLVKSTGFGSEPKHQLSRGGLSGALSLRRSPNLEVITSTAPQERLRSTMPEGFSFRSSPGASTTAPQEKLRSTMPEGFSFLGSPGASKTHPRSPCSSRVLQNASSGNKWDKTGLADLFSSQEHQSSSALVPPDQIYLRTVPKGPPSLGALRTSKSNPTSPSYGSWRKEDYLPSSTPPISPVTSRSAGHRPKAHFSFQYPADGSAEYPGTFGARPFDPEMTFLHDGAHFPISSYPSSVCASRQSSRAVSRNPSQAASRHLSPICSPERSPRGTGKRVLLPDSPSGANSPVLPQPQSPTLRKKKRSAEPTSPKEKPPQILATQLCAKLNALRATGNSCCKLDLDAVQAALRPNTGASSLTEELDKEKAFMGKSFSRKALKAQEEKFGSLLEASLGNTMDTVESLSGGLSAMNDAKEEVCGSRHATAVLAERALRAIEGKLQRLTEFRKRQDKYVSCCQPVNREALMQQVIKGADPLEVAADALGFRRFVAHAVHRCPFGVHDGKPQEADKTDFDRLMETFGLPAGHVVLIAAKKILKDGAAGWASAALKKARALALGVLISDEEKEERKKKRIFMKSAARDGVSEKMMRDTYETVARVALLARKVGALSGEEEDAIALAAIEEELRVESVQLCADCLKKETDRLMEEDEELAEECLEKPFLGGVGAMKAQEKLSQLVNEALKKGVESRHDNVRQARMKITDLKAESIRRDAQCMIFKSEEEYKKKGWIEDAATKCADSVEKMIQNAISGGIPDSHPKLTAAYMASKELREQEGFRKREFNAQKRRT